VPRRGIGSGEGKVEQSRESCDRWLLLEQDHAAPRNDCPQAFVSVDLARALEEALTSGDPTQANIRRSVERKLNADYVDAVNAKDVQVTKNGNKITASVSWEQKLPLFHNVSLLMEFNAEATR